MPSEVSLNRLAAAVVRLELHNHGKKPVLVELPDGSLVEVQAIKAYDDKVIIEVHKE